MESITLYFKQGSSDKIYKAAIEPQNGKFVVNFAYGRRGSTLATGTKTPSGVEYGAAKAIFDKLVKEKTSKGYTPGADGTPYQHSDKEQDHTGILPQLLNPVEEVDVERLVCDDDYCMQEKHDGRCVLTRKIKTLVEGINKLGLIIGIPLPVSQGFQAFRGNFVCHGEMVAEVYHVFDLLEAPKNLRGKRYKDRLLDLMNFIAGNPPDGGHIMMVRTAFTTSQKREFLQELRDRGAEGVVFKHLNAAYTPGRPASGGSQFKFKFCESASFIVGKVNAKRSVSLKLFDGTTLVSVGNVTIPANKSIPNPDDVVEVRYLYAFKGGSIFQPVYLGPRDDVKAEECGVDQLKYKAEPQTQAA